MVSDSYPVSTIRSQKGDHVIHHDRLKMCNDRDIPLWLRRLRHLIFSDSMLHDDSAESTLHEDLEATLPYREGESTEHFGRFQSVGDELDFLFSDNQQMKELGENRQGRLSPPSIDCPDTNI